MKNSIRNLTVWPLITILYSSVSIAQTPYLTIDLIIKSSQQHLTNRLTKLKPDGHYPRTLDPDQSLVTVKSSDWTSGFFPGILWYMYEYTNDRLWQKQAMQWTAGLEFEKYNSGTHDLGFMLFSSFGNGYRLTQRSHYKNILIDAATTLITRYNPKVGCIRSWDDNHWKFPVIIDNMMNLELLFWAAKTTGNEKFYEIAIDHANHTLKNHYRENGSSYHVVDYDPVTGKILSKTTAQGFADESSWARGQAWGLYGITMTYRETKDVVYLNHAEKIADYIIKNLPRNKIPYWDFDAPNVPFEFQDASAAAIAASALLELSQYSENQDHYFLTAEKILRTLCSPSFFAKEKTNGDFFLMHGVGNKPGNSEINVPLIYADYYFLEALLRYDALKK